MGANQDSPAGPTLPPVRARAADPGGRPSYLALLPKYAGIAPAERIGFSVGESAHSLVRLAAIKRQSMYLAAARMSGVPKWELKPALARMWEDATNYRLLEDRLAGGVAGERKKIYLTITFLAHTTFIYQGSLTKN